MKKHLFKFLAVFLSVLIAVMSFPLSAFATSINGTNGQKKLKHHQISEKTPTNY